MDPMEAVLDTNLQRLNEMNPSDNNTQELKHLMDKLSSIDYQMASVNAQAIQDVLLLIMELMPSNTEHILSKFCQVLQSFACKSKVTLNEKFLIPMVNFFINSSQCCENTVLPNILYALSSLLYGNVGRLELFYEKLVSPKGVLLSKASAKNDTLVQLAALKCLQSLTFRNQSDIYLTPQQLLDICTVCVSHMRANASEINSHINCKIILTCLKCLQHIIAPKIISAEGLGELLGLLKAFLYCGFPGQTTVTPMCLYPTLMSLYVPEPKHVDNNSTSNKSHFQRQKVNKNRSRRPNTRKKNKEKEEKKNEEESDGESSFRKSFTAQCNVHSNEAADSGDWWRTSSSDSDFSDVEERSSIKLKSLHISIRQHAYCSLHAIIKAVEKKAMFGYWSSFLPDSPSVASCSQLNIFTTILKDPSPQVRLSAVSVLTDMMRGSKQFLLLVDDRTPSHTSFITASSVLTTMVNELHRCLLLALISETTPTLLTQILKCYATLADVVPYQRLKIDVLQKLLKHLQSLLTHKDSQVQVACLTVYGSLLNSEQIPKEVVDQIIDYKPCDSQNMQNVSYKNDRNIALPWIMTTCKECLENKSPPPLRVEALQVFRIVSVRYFSLMRSHIMLVQQIILSNLQDEQPSLQLHGAKLLESIGRGILNDVNNQTSDELLLDDEDLDIIFNFWNSILTGPFPACLSNEDQPTLCSVCCDCLSTIPPKVFARLLRKVRIFCMTMMFGLSIDADHNIRGAAIRCLGIYSLFPSLREDLSFLSDSARILTSAVEDTNVIVRAQASWAMGNLSDALFLSRDEFPGFADQVTIPFFYALGMASVKASEDCDRIKTNAVRALGNLLHYLPSHFLDDDRIKDFITKAQLSLLSALSAKFMKVCWNACYAFGNALRNECLVQSKHLNLEEILLKLISMLSSVNSKVRINAILALSMLTTRQLYGDFFISVCNEFIMMLSTAGAGVDFKELKHCESLCDTLCFSLCQLLLLANTEDFKAINKNTLEVGETLLTSMWKFGSRTSKDKIDVLDTACQHIECLLDLKENEIMTTQSLELWRDILNQGKEAFYQK